MSQPLGQSAVDEATVVAKIPLVVQHKLPPLVIKMAMLLTLLNSPDWTNSYKRMDKSALDTHNSYLIDAIGVNNAVIR